MPTNVEIEKKYVIAKPDISQLCMIPEYTYSEIEQIYLASPSGITHRIRSRRFPSGVKYTETVKVRIDKMSANETEREITQERYFELRENIAPESVPVIKERHTFPYGGHTFEIDVYPNWEKSCIMEVELSSRDEDAILPPFISVIAEVTGDKRYSNASMSRRFPEELTCDISSR